MDFEKIVAKTLFSDMPIESSVQSVLANDSEKFLADFLAVARHGNSAFTESELSLLQRDFNEVWCKVENKELNTHPIFARCFKLLFRLSEQFLCFDGKNPIVHFDSLLRWRMFSLILGEDALTTSYLAAYSKTHGCQFNSFAWPDVLSHDEDNLNRILCKGMSDVHAHYGASCAIFNLSWVSMMNDISTNTDFVAGNLFKYCQEAHTSSTFVSKTYSLRTLWIVAAFIRKEFYRLLYLSSEEVNFKQCWRYLNEDIIRYACINDIQADINTFALNSFRDRKGERIDYALSNDAGMKSKESIHVIESGEREILYRFFSKYQNGDKSVWKYSGYFYLYLLIKNRIRQELEHTNLQVGFLNFKHYQDRKTSFIPKKGLVYRNYHNFVVQSSCYTENDKLELRIGGKQTVANFSNLTFMPNLYSITPLSKVTIQNRLSIIYSFYKATKDKSLQQNCCRYASFRNQIMLKCFELINEHRKSYPIRLTGVDAAGNELNCRPEVFAHAFRYLQEYGNFGRTYHVGEDFYDLIDGLRAVDEAVIFLELGKKDRLGHALALGVNPHDYYKNRRYNIVMPRQNLLDNYVWLYHEIKVNDVKTSSSLLLDLENRASLLYYQIGYKNFSMLKCWHAWLLRGEGETEEKNTPWGKTSFSKCAIISNARLDTEAVEMNLQYNHNPLIKQKGAKVIEEKLPKGIEKIVEDLQDAMIRKISEKDVYIETNPSSNICIGPFEKYEDLPLFNFAPMEQDVHSSVVNVSVNTDDRGVFATSLYHEFSLIAAALFKQKDKDGNRLWSNEAIYDYIDRLRSNGFNQRFN